MQNRDSAPATPTTKHGSKSAKYPHSSSDITFSGVILRALAARPDNEDQIRGVAQMPTITDRRPEVWLILRKREGILTDARAVPIASEEELEDMCAANAHAINGEDGAISQRSILLTACYDVQRAEWWAEQINAAIIEWIGGDLS